MSIAETLSASPLPSSADPEGEFAIPLCVDLDGSLIHTDLLYESLLELLHHRPWMLLCLPLWLLRGIAYLKQQVALRVSLDPSGLPYDVRLLERLHELHGQRPMLLCSGADERLAVCVAEHLGLFSETLASDGRLNLTGLRKVRLLSDRFGVRGYDYVGNQRADLAVWREAREAWVVNAGQGLMRAAQQLCPCALYLPPQHIDWQQWLKALRPHQWLKNLLIFTPLLAAHRVLDGEGWQAASLAFIAFSLCASGLYLANDLLDLKSDRQHPHKRQRPFAAGRLSLAMGMLASPVLIGASFVLATVLPGKFAFFLLLYSVCTLLYSFLLKRRAMLDVITLAGLYTLRIIAGAAAVGTPLSFWFLAFSMFLFLGLAMVKRYTELLLMHENGHTHALGRAYAVADLPLIQALGGASSYMAVLVLALYIHSDAGNSMYREPETLWLLCPLLLLWVSRIWLKAHRGLMDDDPLIFAARDPGSWGIFLIASGVVLWAV